MATERKLAAIMYTDIAEYTALSAKDESKALELLDKQRQILIPIIEEYNGTLHKEIGDGLLLTFPTVTDAVKCGIKIQINAKAVAHLNLRIGIHEGEITLKDGDIFGDDVNVVSRMHPFSAIGGIAITGKVQQNISSLPEFSTDYVGQPQLKGVSQEVKVYCITSHGLPQTDPSIVTAKIEEKRVKSRLNVFSLTGGILTVIGIAFWVWIGIFDLSFGGKEEIPSISILMMDHVGERGNESWTRSLTHDIIEELRNVGGIVVQDFNRIESFDSHIPLDSIYHHLQTEHIFKSELIKDVERMQLKVKYRIINVKSEEMIHSGEIIKDYKDISLLVKTISRTILGIYEINEGIHDHKIDPYHADAYGLYMEGLHLISLRLGKIPSQDERTLGRQLLVSALQLDPHLKEAYIQLGWDYINNGEYQKSRDIYNQLLSTSQEINDSSGMHSALIMSATINLSLGNYSKAEDEFKESLHFSTSHKTIVALNKLGIIYREKGLFNESKNFHEKALSISIKENEYFYQGVSNHYLGESYFYFKEYSKALELFNSALEMWGTLGNKPQEIWTQSWRLLVIAELNKIRKNKSLLSEVEFLLNKSKPHPSDRKIVYWNLYMASKKILETNNIIFNLKTNKQPEYYLDLAYEILNMELNNRYLEPKELEILKNNIRLNKNIILERNKLEKLQDKKNI